MDGRGYFDFTNDDFRQVSEYSACRYGIYLKETKKDLIYARIARRMRVIGENSFEAYFDKIKSDKSQTEVDEFLSLLTTNVTSFFREVHHFEYLRSMLIKRLSTLRGGGAINIWSAGCSSGQEAFSIAMIVDEISKEFGYRHINIIATDVDERVLEKARAATYDASEVLSLSDLQRKAIFGVRLVADGRYRVISSLKERVDFRRLNLIDGWRISEKFDVIFCRNVVIYFERKTQHDLWCKFHNQLKPGGLLCLGQSERISGECSSGFKCDGITAYRKLT